MISLFLFIRYFRSCDLTSDEIVYSEFTKIYHYPGSISIDSIIESNKYPTVFLPLEGNSSVILETNSSKIKVTNDSLQEFYVLFKLIGRKAKQYKVIAYDGWEQFIDSGFIPDTTPLRIFSSVYMPDYEPLKLHKEPSESSSYIPIARYIPDELKVLDFSGDWLLVEYVYEGDLFTGWLSPSQQCANIWTTCS